MRAARPDLKLYTTVFTWDEAAQDSVSLREAGIDLNSISALEGIEVVEARGTYGRREPEAASNQRRRQRLLAPEALTVSPARAWLSTASYVEVTEAIVPPRRIGLPAQTKQTWLSAAMVPAGVHILERYVAQLARNDAFLLGDGGNGYAIGQPVLHAWLREFTALPARTFSEFLEAPAPLKVRWLEYDGKLLVYALNTDARDVLVALSLERAREMRRLGTGKVLRPVDGRVQLRLGPFGLAALEAPAGARVREISVTRPNEP